MYRNSCISQWSYKICSKRNPNKVRNSSIYVFITLKKFGPEFTKCLVPNSPDPENIWSRIHHLVPSSLGPEFTWSRIHLIPFRVLHITHFCESLSTNSIPIISKWKKITHLFILILVLLILNTSCNCNVYYFSKIICV